MRPCVAAGSRKWRALRRAGAWRGRNRPLSGNGAPFLLNGMIAVLSYGAAQPLLGFLEPRDPGQAGPGVRRACGETGRKKRQRRRG